jgi:hypothetical protein
LLLDLTFAWIGSVVLGDEGQSHISDILGWLTVSKTKFKIGQNFVGTKIFLSKW